MNSPYSRHSRFLFLTCSTLWGTRMIQRATVRCALLSARPPLRPSLPDPARPKEGTLVTAMLNKVPRLQNQGKVVDAAALRETIPKGRNFERAH